MKAVVAFRESASDSAAFFFPACLSVTVLLGQFSFGHTLGYSCSWSQQKLSPGRVACLSQVPSNLIVIGLGSKDGLTGEDAVRNDGTCSGFKWVVNLSSLFSNRIGICNVPQCPNSFAALVQAKKFIKRMESEGKSTSKALRQDFVQVCVCVIGRGGIKRTNICKFSYKSYRLVHLHGLYISGARKRWPSGACNMCMMELIFVCCVGQHLMLCLQWARMHQGRK